MCSSDTIILSARLICGVAPNGAMSRLSPEGSANQAIGHIIQKYDIAIYINK